MTTTLILLGAVLIALVAAAVARFKPSAKTIVRSVAGSLLGINALIVAAVAIFLLAPGLASAQETASPQDGTTVAASERGTGDTAMAAAVATGLAAVGAGIAVGIAGSAAIGSITEKPEMLGRTLIFVGLAEGIAIYGLIISFLLLTGTLGG